MKHKLIIAFSILLLLVVVAFMAIDLFKNKEPEKNPYDYNIGKLRQVDEKLLCYNEISQIKPPFDSLHGLAIDNQGRIYISGKNNIAIYSHEGAPLKTFLTEGTAKCLAVDENENIFLGMTDHIEVVDNEGNLLSNWEILNEQVFITSIALDESSVFVADAGNKIVYHYDRDGSFRNEIGRKNPEIGIPGFIIPSPYFDLAIGREGQLWVVNPGRHALEAYTPDGELISTWARTSMQEDGFSGCCNPSHIALLEDGKFVTSEKGIERVKIIDQSGEFVCLVASPGMFEEGTTGLDLAIDSHQRIFVLDPKRGMVRIFEEKEK